MTIPHGAQAGWLEDPVGVPQEKHCTDSYGEYLDLLASW